MSELDEKSEEEKLKKLKMVIGHWIDETIKWEEWEKYEKRNDEEWIEKETLNIMLREKTLEVVLEKMGSPIFDFWLHVSPSSVSSSEVQCSVVRLIERTTNRMQSVEEDAPRHWVVCVLLAKVFEDIENPNQTLLNSTVFYLVKIFQSQHWITIERAKILSNKLLDRKELSEELRKKLNDALKEIKVKSEKEVLKEMVIGYSIEEIINEKEWMEYKRRNDEEWIEREGMNTLLSEETFVVVLQCMQRSMEKRIDPVSRPLLSIYGMCQIFVHS